MLLVCQTDLYLSWLLQIGQDLCCNISRIDSLELVVALLWGTTDWL